MIGIVMALSFLFVGAIVMGAWWLVSFFWDMGGVMGVIFGVTVLLAGLALLANAGE